MGNHTERGPPVLPTERGPATTMLNATERETGKWGITRREVPPLNNVIVPRCDARYGARSTPAPISKPEATVLASNTWRRRRSSAGIHSSRDSAAAGHVDVGREAHAQ